MPDFAVDAEKSRTAKVALRGRLLAERRALSAQDRDSAAARLQVTLRDVLVRAPGPRVIAGYVPVGAEPGGPALPELLAPLGTLILPVLRDDGDLDWAAYEGPSSLRQATRGLHEPAGRRLGVEAVHEATHVIVPALAVDRTGARLGRGGGSYDRALARVSPTAFTIALLHDGEVRQSVPVEPHDRRVWAAITPEGGLIPLSGPPDWTK